MSRAGSSYQQSILDMLANNGPQWRWTYREPSVQALLSKGLIEEYKIEWRTCRNTKPHAKRMIRLPTP